jgi:hypothetical protein
MDLFRKPAAGDPLKIPAAVYSELLDCLAYVRQLRNRSGPARARGRRDNGIIDIRNDTSAAIAEFGILGVAGVVFSPTDSLKSFQNEPLYKGAAPTIASHDGNFAVALEPIAAGKIGQARVSGLVCAQVAVSSGLDWYGFADVTNNDATQLTLLPSGAAQVLYKESGTGTKWAIVRIGLPPGNVSGDVVLDAQLAPASSAVASFWDGDPMADTGNNATVYDGDANWHLMNTGDTAFPAGTRAVVKWRPKRRKWQLENAACSASS